MSYSSTRAAATSSCVESGFDAQTTTSAPPALRVRIRFAVSVVTCRHAAEARREGDVGELDPEAPAQLAQRVQLIHLAEPVEPEAAGASPRDDESRALEIPEHPRRPARPGGGVADGESVHPRNLSTSV